MAAGVQLLLYGHALMGCTLPAVCCLRRFVSLHGRCQLWQRATPVCSSACGAWTSGLCQTVRGRPPLIQVTPWSPHAPMLSMLCAQPQPPQPNSHSVDETLRQPEPCQHQHQHQLAGTPKSWGKRSPKRPHTTSMPSAPHCPAVHTYRCLWLLVNRAAARGNSPSLSTLQTAAAWPRHRH